MSLSTLFSIISSWLLQQTRISNNPIVWCCRLLTSTCMVNWYVDITIFILFIQFVQSNDVLISHHGSKCRCVDIFSQIQVVIDPYWTISITSDLFEIVGTNGTKVIGKVWHIWLWIIIIKLTTLLLILFFVSKITRVYIFKLNFFILFNIAQLFFSHCRFIILNSCIIIIDWPDRISHFMPEKMPCLFNYFCYPGNIVEHNLYTNSKIKCKQYWLFIVVLSNMHGANNDTNYWNY